MHYDAATNLIIRNTKQEFIDSPFRPKIDFVSPVMQVLVAAAVTGGNTELRKVEFANEDCSLYAQYTGLKDALKGQSPIGDTGHLHGKT